MAAANELLSDPEKRARFDRGEIDADGHERAPRPSYRDHVDGEFGRRYSDDGRQSGGLNEGDFVDVFGSVFGGGGGESGRGDDERYSLAADFLSAVKGALTDLRSGNFDGAAVLVT